MFDGVHIGHRKVIEAAVRRARNEGLKSIVVTFDPHPSAILSPSKKALSLISLEHRLGIFKRLGVDIAVVINFAKPFARMSPENFVKSILINSLGARFIYTGKNFYFGNSAAAGPAALKKIASPYGVKVYSVPPVKASGEIVSSSLIRKYITSGELKKARQFLGRPVSILGTVVRGARFARVLGYPTANINPHHEVIPPSGVYAVSVRIGDVLRGGVLNIGKRPTFYAPRDEEPDIEAHIFGFRSQIYGKVIEVYFVRKIRDERQFKDAGSLIKQIAKDKNLACKVMSKQQVQNKSGFTNIR